MKIINKILSNTSKFVFFSMLFLFSFNLASASSIGLEPLNRACLPELGRMQEDQTKACHCPPQSMCPADITEWNEAKMLPPRIQGICCKIPKSCTFAQDVVTACGGTNQLTSKTEKYCTKFTINSSETSSPEYKALETALIAIVTQIIAYRDQLRTLSLSAQTQANYNAAVTIIAQIRSLETQAYNLPITLAGAGFTAYAGGRLGAARAPMTVTCATSASPNFCTNFFSSPCPPPPSPCRISWAQWYTLTATQQDQMSKTCGSVEYWDCVAEGTKVMMADGSQKAIQELKVGEFIKGYNANNRITSVTLEEEGHTFLHSINDGKLNITAQHPILTTKGWKAIDPTKVNASDEFLKEITKLEVGDEIVIPDEATVKVTKIGEYVGPKVPTYNLSVNGDKTFIANGMVIRAFIKNNSY